VETAFEGASSDSYAKGLGYSRAPAGILRFAQK
jgi:hypothetical protein